MNPFETSFDVKSLITPWNPPVLIQLIGVVGTHVPSLSLVVTCPSARTPMPFGARKPRARTSNFFPSSLTLNRQPEWEHTVPLPIEAFWFPKPLPPALTG